MKKLKSEIEWIGIAKSADETRININSIYRDLDCIVATDGDRLHKQKACKSNQAYYMSSLDASLSYPDYNQVFPSNIYNHKAMEIHQDDLKNLNLFYDAVKKLKIKVPVFKLLAEKNSVTLLSQFDNAFNLSITFEAKTFKSVSVGIDILYFIEALNMMQFTNAVTIYSENTDSPILIESASEQLQAVVMPMRIKQC